MKKKIQRKDFSKLNTLKFAFSMAVIVSIFVFALTLLAVSNVIGSFLIITSIIFEIYGRLGYSVSVIGSLIGAVLSFIDAFIIGFIFAWIYNKIN